MVNETVIESITVELHAQLCGGEFSRFQVIHVVGSVGPVLWCPKCGALGDAGDGTARVPKILRQLHALTAYVLGDGPEIFQTTEKVADMVSNIHDRFDVERNGHAMMLEYYGKLFAKTAELRERRDGLLTHNTELVTQNRALQTAKEAAVLEAVDLDMELKRVRTVVDVLEAELAALKGGKD